MERGSKKQKTKLDRLYSGEKVLCDNCKKGYYEVVNGGKVVAGYKCNGCGSFIHVTPGSITIE